MIQYLGTAVSTVIAAPIEALWPIVSDPTRHAELAGSGEVLQVEVVGDAPLGLGSLFRSQQNRSGLRYVTMSRVVAWEPPYRFAWRIGVPQLPGAAQVWQFALERRDGGTWVENSVTLPYVTPTFGPFGGVRDLVARSEAATMYPTLKNLARLVGASEPDTFETQLDPPDSTAELLPSPLIQGTILVAGVALLGTVVARRRRM